MNENSEDSHYRLLFELAPDAILVVDDSGEIRMNNAQAENLLEAAAGELVGMNVDRLVPISARKRHVNLRADFSQSSKGRPMGAGLSLNAVKVTGREFPVEISLSSNLRGGRREVIVVMRDVSERLAARRTEVELRRANTLTALTKLALRERDFQKLSDLVVRTLLEPLGADVVVMMDRTGDSDNCFVRSVAGESAELVMELLAAGVPFSKNSEFPVLVGDDAENKNAAFPIANTLGFRSYTSAPLFQNKVCIGILTMACRSPLRFKAEDLEFLEAVTNIISTALERSNAEEKLVDAMRLESLGQLTGGIAHDFNNLLTVIFGNLQLLEVPEIANLDRDRAITAAKRAARSGADLTAKLLSFSRRQTLRPTQVDIAALLGSFQDLLVRTLGAGIELQFNIESGLPLSLVDGGQLESALLNLVVNARDAMPAGGLLSVSATCVRIAEASFEVINDQLKPGAYVRISVSDSGSGMSAETIDRIFEPFFTTKSVGKGSGLGLSMVYGFAKQSGGHVNVKSKLENGSFFNLFIPVVVDTADKRIQLTEIECQNGNGERVLIVEDDLAVLDVAIQSFKLLGYQTISATTQAQAVNRLLEYGDTILVFSDVVLGGNETGPQIFATLQAIKPSLRILLTSGYTRENFQSQLNVDDSVELLRKPYTIEEMAAATKRALS
jgi:PAS domain S-box-containing protein